MIFRLLVPVCLLMVSCAAVGTRAKGGGEPKWKLVWQDEFNTAGSPDSSKWSFSGRGRANWACYCYDDTATAVVLRGRLLLRGIHAKGGTDTAKYQTGCIQSKGKFSFLYGKMDVRAKLPQGGGSWPAIWLMPEKSVYGGWPKSGEIDVMEHLNRDTIFYQTLHSAYTYELKKTNDPKHSATAAFKVGEFNVYGMEWYADRIDFLINGVRTFSYPKVANDSMGVQWPFDQPFYIILNQALGGSWAGPINDGDVPQQFEVDYVRVYQQQ